MIWTCESQDHTSNCHSF